MGDIIQNPGEIASKIFSGWQKNAPEYSEAREDITHAKK
jgi:hypothetical protein